MARKRNADCFYYYRGFCYKGNRCSFRHEPRALGSQIVCKQWQRNRCNAPNCPRRHSNLYLANPSVWEDRVGKTPFLKSRYFLENPRTSLIQRHHWIRKVIIDSSRIEVRRNGRYREGNDTFNSETCLSRENLKVTLKRVEVTSQNFSDALDHHCDENLEKKIAQCPVFKDHFSGQLLDKDLPDCSSNILSHELTSNIASCSASISENASVPTSSVISMRYKPVKDGNWEKISGSLKCGGGIIVKRETSPVEGNENRSVSTVEPTKENLEKENIALGNKFYVDPVVLMNFLLYKQKRQRALLSLSGVEEHLDVESDCAPQHVLSELQILAEQGHSWGNNVSNVSSSTSKFAENSASILNSPSCSTKSNNSSASVAMNDVNRIRLTAMSGYNGERPVKNEMFANNSSDADSISLEAPKNDELQSAKRECETTEGKEVSVNCGLFISIEETGGREKQMDKEICIAGHLNKTKDTMEMESSNDPSGNSESKECLCLVGQTPIPRIRLKRSRSAGSKETWKIRRPRPKTRKRSSRKNDSSKSPEHKTGQFSPVRRKVQSDNESCLVLDGTSGSDIFEATAEPKRYFTRSHARSERSTSV